MISENKRLKAILAIGTLLLLIPFIGMQFSNEIDWKLNDFIIAGVLLYGTGLIIELILRKVNKQKDRMLLTIAALVLLLLIWLELAVGIFGTPIAGS